MAYFSLPNPFLLLFREDGWDEAMILRRFSGFTHGQLPLLIHLPDRHFLSFSMLTKLLVRGGG